MKRLAIPLALLLGLGIVSCNGQAPSSDTPKTTPKTVRAAAPAPRYEVRGIIDPGINNMVAFAFKIPYGWQLHQSFQRAWSGAVPSNVIYISLNSPDKHTVIEFLPEVHYHFVDGPQTRSMAQLAAQYGGMHDDPGSLAPMLPLNYLKQIVLPQLAKTAGGRVRVTGEKTNPVQNLGQGKQRASAYIDGLLPAGRKVRIESILQTFTNNLSGEVYCNWSATTSITQSDADLAAAYAHTTAAQKSVVLNPAWQQQTQQLVSNGQQTNNAETQKRNAINQDFQQYRNKVYSEIAANRQASQDRRNEAFGDYIRGEAKYEDAATGQRVKVQDNYRHVYRDNQGNTLITNVPLDASHVNWQELQRVEVKNY